MNRLIFIRHGTTNGNLSRRYIGRTDEPLCEVGIKQIEELKKESFCVDEVFVSPLLRARQSAEILFPGMEYTVIDDFRETDFGIFEGKSTDELSDSPEYRAWVNSWCKGPVPGGEPSEQFKARCCDAFARVMDFLNKNDTAAFVIHGGVIMAIMERYAVPRKDFYAYHIANGEWISCVYENGTLVLKKCKLHNHLSRRLCILQLFTPLNPAAGVFAVDHAQAASVVPVHMDGSCIIHTGNCALKPFRH